MEVGNQANRLVRGERVSIVCKTRHKPRALAIEGAPSTTKSIGKKADKKVAKKPKAPSTTTNKTKKKAKTDDIEELSDDFDEDIVEIIHPSTQYPLIPAAKSAGRCVLFRNIESPVLCAQSQVSCSRFSEFRSSIARLSLSYLKIGVQVSAIIST